MRNLEKFAVEGQKKIKNNSRYDIQVSDMSKLLQESTPEQAIIKAFYAGVEAGSRIQKKKNASNRREVKE